MSVALRLGGLQCSHAGGSAKMQKQFKIFTLNGTCIADIQNVESLYEKRKWDRVIYTVKTNNQTHTITVAKNETHAVYSI